MYEIKPLKWSQDPTFLPNMGFHTRTVFGWFFVGKIDGKWRHRGIYHKKYGSPYFYNSVYYRGEFDTAEECQKDMEETYRQKLIDEALEISYDHVSS